MSDECETPAEGRRVTVLFSARDLDQISDLAEELASGRGYPATTSDALREMVAYWRDNHPAASTGV